jgi:hypothetical protein
MEMMRAVKWCALDLSPMTIASEFPVVFSTSNPFEQMPNNVEAEVRTKQRRASLLCIFPFGIRVFVVGSSYFAPPTSPRSHRLDNFIGTTYQAAYRPNRFNSAHRNGGKTTAANEQPKHSPRSAPYSPTIPAMGPI